jgi:ABC-type sugar transport system permease subunit
VTQQLTSGAPLSVRGGGAPHPPGSTARRRRHRFQPAWLFMAPSLIILSLFVFYPIGSSVYYSLFDWTIGASSQKWLGGGNYSKLLHDAQFWNSLRVTVTFSVVSVVVLLALGFVTAVVLLPNTLANRIVRSILLFPTIVSFVTIGMVWKFLLDPDIGLVGGLTKALGFTPVAWLQTPSLALPTVIFVAIWRSAGFTIVLFIAGLQNVPPELYEAARLDGASGRQLIRHITLPQIRPTLLFTTTILTIQSLQVFDLVFVMTGGGPLYATDSLVNLLYRYGFVNFQTGYASAIAQVLLLIIMIVSLIQLRVFRFNDVD